MQWITLSRSETDRFIQAVQAAEHPVIFEPSICEAHKTALPFYKGYDLIRLVNKNMLPFLVMDYISNGTDTHYYLNGSDAAFHIMNAAGALQLNEENVAYYASLYIACVYERGNSLQDPEDQPFLPAVYHAAEGCYHLKTPLLYHDKMIEALVKVTPQGAIRIDAPLTVTLLEEVSAPETIPYTHPFEPQIIEQAKGLLYGTETGERLLKFGDQHNIPLRVLGNPNYQGYITNQPVVYICMPAAEQNAKYMQALLLAGGLRDAEQVMSGALHPHIDEPGDTYLKANIGKNLDVGMEMCKIVAELEDQNIGEALHDLQMLGLGPLYEGFKQGKNIEALYDVYANIMRREEIVIEE